MSNLKKSNLSKTEKRENEKIKEEDEFADGGVGYEEDKGKEHEIKEDV